MVKNALCDYIAGETEENGTEALRLYLPAARGYILHMFIHSVKEACGCDTWRLGPAYHVSDDLSNAVLLTRPRAEWEMAIRLKERPDFIGGLIHGDVRYTAADFVLDGTPITPAALTSPTPFSRLEITVKSEGFDPINPQTGVLLHDKTLIITPKDITVHQRLEWLGDYPLGNSYMAMMPPLKEWTNSYKIDTISALNPILPEGARETVQTEELYLCGDTYGFSMRVPRYLSYPEGNRYLITDNGGSSYNKMYFILAHGGFAHTGDVWETETVYRIDVLSKGENHA